MPYEPRLSREHQSRVTGSGHPACWGHMRDMCEPVVTQEMWAAALSDPSGAAGNQSILPDLLSQPGARHWCSTDSSDAGAARDWLRAFPVPHLRPKCV